MSLFRLVSKRIKLTNYYYSQKFNLTTKKTDEGKDLVFKDINENKPKPQRLPAYDEDKDVWPIVKSSFNNLSKFFLFLFLRFELFNACLVV
jgi:hypothetical protein